MYWSLDDCFFCFVATWSNGPKALNACCATNEVVQFFVCCGTFVASVGLNAELVFSQAMSLSTLCAKFQLFVIISLEFETTSSGVRVGVSVWVSGGPCVRVYGCVGDWVSFFCSFLFASTCLPGCRLASECFNNTRHNTTYNGHSTPPHDRIPSQPYRHFLVSKVRTLDDLEWPAPDKRKVE